MPTFRYRKVQNCSNWHFLAVFSHFERFFAIIVIFLAELVGY
jgi:hypothetical protein